MTDPEGQEPIEKEGSRIWTVSYTHLDVYKRQAHEGEKFVVHVKNTVHKKTPICDKLIDH